ncbi:hypothetical protein HAZT_HAZT003773 [Hyalella azteca]|uniref:Uncharacterized protein n=1 Tax=Hyalella azteca TaxID=294128 RepID=A0A6A0HBW9_HYAAZ|nr:hypothetical protein HAZT_HAZT003773 [Hyalella azteca]
MRCTAEQAFESYESPATLHLGGQCSNIYQTQASGVDPANTFCQDNYYYSKIPNNNYPGNMFGTFLNSPIVYNGRADSSSLAYSNPALPYGYVSGAPPAYSLPRPEFYGYSESYVSPLAHDNMRANVSQSSFGTLSNGTTYYCSPPPADQLNWKAVTEPALSSAASMSKVDCSNDTAVFSNAHNTPATVIPDKVDADVSQVSVGTSAAFPSTTAEVSAQLDMTIKINMKAPHTNLNSISGDTSQGYQQSCNYNSNHTRGPRGENHAGTIRRDNFDYSRGQGRVTRSARGGYRGRGRSNAQYCENRVPIDEEEEMQKGRRAALAEAAAFMSSQKPNNNLSSNMPRGQRSFANSNGSRGGREKFDREQERHRNNVRQGVSNHDAMLPSGFEDQADRGNRRGKGRGGRRGRQEEFSEQERRYGYDKEYKTRQDLERYRDAAGRKNIFKSESRSQQSSELEDGKQPQPHSAQIPGHRMPSRPLTFSSSRVDTEEDRRNQREQLIEMLRRGTYECIVCCDRIKPQHAIWSCSTCFNCFHLGCIKKWANSSQQVGESGWRCPTCNDQNTSRPNTYKCFCGKLREPEYNHVDIPHSCGELCGRRKDEWCTHKCNELCHPGPCPPCMAYIKKSCGCGALTKDVRCSGGSETLLCGGICGKQLSCTAHTCPLPCHAGPCADCKIEVVQTCHCTQSSRTVKCDSESHVVASYECGKVCDKLLDCGHHKCKRLCHEGDCDECFLTVDKVNSCPCGKKPLQELYDELQVGDESKTDGKNLSKTPTSGINQNENEDQLDLNYLSNEEESKDIVDSKTVVGRQKCTDPIPTCGSECGKRLLCGKPGSFHLCAAKCHEGPCPVCSLNTPVRCRCGNMDKNLPCEKLTTKADEVTCQKQCKKLRFCGRHKCGIKCCIDVDHVCPLKCGKWLSCGKHKCSQDCHRGSCYKCPEVSWDDLSCHCGSSSIPAPIPCGTKPPLCGNPCQRPRACEHPASHECHPEQTCPPCTTLDEKPCFGKHKMMRSTPCYLTAISCGELCDAPLRCGLHKCQRICHDGACITGSGSCPQKCTKPRPGCGHPCNNPCHSGECPTNNCKETVTVSCKCGTRTSVISCAENEREYRAMASVKLAQMQHGNSGVSVDLSNILGPSKDSLKRLECNDACHAKNRMTRLALALQIENPESRNSLGTSATTLAFSDFLKNMANKDPQFASMVHKALYDLVLKARDVSRIYLSCKSYIRKFPSRRPVATRSRRCRAKSVSSSTSTASSSGAPQCRMTRSPRRTSWLLPNAAWSVSKYQYYSTKLIIYDPF